MEEEPVMEEEEAVAAPEPEPPAEAPPEPATPDEVPEPPILERQQTQVQEPVAKKRGRPPKAKAEPPTPKVKAVPKAKTTRAPKEKKPPPPPDSDSSSDDVDETLRNVYNHVAKPDMETAILQFLVNRKQSEQARRRELWGRLAQM